MQPWRRYAVPDGQVERADQVMERQTCGAGADAVTSVEAEQRRLCAPAWVCGLSSFGLLLEQLSHARSKWDEAALAELASDHHEQAAVEIDVTQAQSAHLTGT